MTFLLWGIVVIPWPAQQLATSVIGCFSWRVLLFSCYSPASRLFQQLDDVKAANQWVDEAN